MNRLILVLSVFFTSLSGWACKYDLKVTTQSEKEASVSLAKYNGYELDTLETFKIDVRHDYKKPLRDLDTGLYVIAMSNEVRRMFFVSKTEDILISLNRTEYYDDFVIDSPENKMLDSLSGMYNRFISEIERCSSEINQTPRTKKNYYSLTDSLSNVRDLKANELNKAIDSFCSRNDKSLATKYFRPLFLVNTRLEQEAANTSYETDESFQFDHFMDKLMYPNRIVTAHPMYYLKIDEYFVRYAEKTNEGLLAAADRIVETVENNKNSRDYVIKYILRLFERNTNEEFYLQASEKYLNSCESEANFASELERIEKIKSLQVGKSAPDIVVTRLGGEKMSLSSLKGSPVILLFWASWCPHCLDELPEIRKQYETLKMKNVKILAVSLDEDAASWTSTINAQGISDWYHSCEFKKWKSPPVLTYNVHRTPTLYIIDEEGIIKAKDVSAKNLSVYF